MLKWQMHHSAGLANSTHSLPPFPLHAAKERVWRRRWRSSCFRRHLPESWRIRSRRGTLECSLGQERCADQARHEPPRQRVGAGEIQGPTACQGRGHACFLRACDGASFSDPAAVSRRGSTRRLHFGPAPRFHPGIQQPWADHRPRPRGASFLQQNLRGWRCRDNGRRRSLFGRRRQRRQ